MRSAANANITGCAWLNRSLVALVCAAATAFSASAQTLRHESFDNEPNWESINSRSTAFPLRQVTQDFGYSAGTTHCGSGPGEIGGTLNPAGEAAYYGFRLPKPADLSAPLSASGKIHVAAGPGHFLLGFFNANTLNEWRTPNTLVLRINSRGDSWHCHLEYCSSEWRAEAGVIGEIIRGERLRQTEIPADKTYGWDLKYFPPSRNERAYFTLKIGEWSARCDIVPEHFNDGATFTHFGILPIPKTWDSPGRAWLDDVTINGVQFDFSADPKWDALNNRRYYLSADTRPRFDFGFSRTHYVRGKSAGEIGGLIFRGDCREAGRMAAYGDRIGKLTLQNKLVARGKVTLLRAISDSAGLIGFYNRAHSLKSNPSQNETIPSDFIGINIEGPSSEGFFFYPVYRAHTDGGGKALGHNGGKSPRIKPDARPHDWTFTYDPSGANGNGQITVTLDRQSCTMDLEAGVKNIGATFDRFGLCTTWIDGNSVTAYFDDLSYSYAPPN
jgi:hypothetical protein